MALCWRRMLALKTMGFIDPVLQWWGLGRVCQRCSGAFGPFCLVANMPWWLAACNYVIPVCSLTPVLLFVLVSLHGICCSPLCKVHHLLIKHDQEDLVPRHCFNVPDRKVWPCLEALSAKLYFVLWEFRGCLSGCMVHTIVAFSWVTCAAVILSCSLAPLAVCVLFIHCSEWMSLPGSCLHVSSPELPC